MNNDSDLPKAGSKRKSIVGAIGMAAGLAAMADMGNPARIQGNPWDGISGGNPYAKKRKKSNRRKQIAKASRKRNRKTKKNR